MEYLLLLVQFFFFYSPSFLQLRIKFHVRSSTLIYPIPFRLAQYTYSPPSRNHNTGGGSERDGSKRLGKMILLIFPSTAALVHAALLFQHFHSTAQKNIQLYPPFHIFYLGSGMILIFCGGKCVWQWGEDGFFRGCFSFLTFYVYDSKMWGETRLIYNEN